MNLIITDMPDQPQPAIDTLCDNCGAIYDLLDCTTGAFGKVLCPDCSADKFRKRQKLPKKYLHLNYKIFRSLYNQNSL